MLMLIGKMLVPFYTVLAAPVSQGAPVDEIFVYGFKKENPKSPPGGAYILVEPHDASRLDSTTHLQKESSIATQETGKSSPTGSVLPRIRGHDVKLTEIYVEDLLLQNPYGGLPIADYLDLRAFGRLEIYQGLSPYFIPSSRPAGALRYQFKKEHADRQKTGIQAGKPYGESIWTLLVHKPETANGTYCNGVSLNHLHDQEFRIFGRHHQTDGRYFYYSDEGTPYNPEDDLILRRKNNDQRSLQMMPSFATQCGPWKFRGLGWWGRTQAGLPTQSARVPSFAREETSQMVLSLGISRETELGPAKHKLIFDLKGLKSQDILKVRDPDARFLNVSDKSNLNLNSETLLSSVHLQTQKVSALLQGTVSISKIHQNYGEENTANIKRFSDTLSLGIRWLLVSKLSLDSKYLARHVKSYDSAPSSEFKEITSSQNPESHSKEQSLSLTWDQNSFQIYAQSAKSTRIATLFEEFGNGTSITPNFKLRPESIRHLESGLSFQYGLHQDQISFALYKDQVDDKIAFVPVYANASKALNVKKATIEGAEARSQISFAFHPHYLTALHTSFLWLKPFDKTRNNPTILPGIAQRVTVLELSQKSPWVTGKWVSRYRSNVYRDVANDVYLPEVWIHDVYLDSSWSHKTLSSLKNQLQIGLMIRNVLDTIDVPIKVKNSPLSGSNSGRTAVSDFSGSPLPGRQWVLSLVVDLG